MNTRLKDETLSNGAFCLLSPCETDRSLETVTFTSESNRISFSNRNQLNKNNWTEMSSIKKRKFYLKQPITQHQ